MSSDSCLAAHMLQSWKDQVEGAKSFYDKEGNFYVQQPDGTYAFFQKGSVFNPNTKE